MIKQDTEQQILAAALEEFASKGFYGARMQSIANRAGTNKALLHYYYRSKELLYEKALTMITNAMWSSIVHPISLLETGDIAGFARTIATFVATEGHKSPYSRILLIELSTGGDRLKKLDDLLADSIDSMQKYVFSFLQRGMDAGNIKPAHPMMIFNNIIGMCWNMFLSEPYADRVYQFDSIQKDETFYSDYIELIVEMTAAGLAVNPI